MKITWHTEAKASYRQIARYINGRFGRKTRQKFLQKVKEAEAMIKHHPEIGPIDPLFADRPRTYRSVVIDGLSKMVYFVEGDIIYISAFWDCRRDPAAEADRMK